MTPKERIAALAGPMTDIPPAPLRAGSRTIQAAWELGLFKYLPPGTPPPAARKTPHKDVLFNVFRREYLLRAPKSSGPRSPQP